MPKNKVAKRDEVNWKAILIVRKAQRDLTKLTGKRLNIEYTLGDIRLTPKDVISIVIELSDITSEEFYSGSIRADIIACRYATICLIKEFFPPLSTIMIGEVIGGAAGSSVTYALIKKDDYMETKDKYFYPLYCKAKEHINHLLEQDENPEA